MSTGDDPHDSSAEAPPRSYAAAMAELDAIMVALEDDDLDVDALTARVARAAELLRWCRTRIADTRMQVQAVVADLEEDGSPS